MKPTNGCASVVLIYATHEVVFLRPLELRKHR